MVHQLEAVNGDSMSDGVAVGKRFGRLLVRAYAGTDRDRRALWRTTCDCGTEVIARTNALTTGRKASCGCSTAERRRQEKEARWAQQLPRTQRPEYVVWASMKARCAPGGHPRYFGRGIRVHPEWEKSFDVFYAYMGPRPSPSHTLDRIDNDGNYEPGNVRWATWVQQNNNQHRPGQLTFDIMGKQYTLSEISVATGISITTIRRRLKNGESIEKAVSRPAEPQAKNAGEPARTKSLYDRDKHRVLSVRAKGNRVRGG